MEKEIEKCCGNCCWFYAEDTYGFGCCPFQFGEVVACDRSCKRPDDFVGKEEMRHHMDEINGFLDNFEVESKRYEPWPYELVKPLTFAIKYMETFSKL